MLNPSWFIFYHHPLCKIKSLLNFCSTSRVHLRIGCLLQLRLHYVDVRSTVAVLHSVPLNTPSHSRGCPAIFWKALSYLCYEWKCSPGPGVRAKVKSVVTTCKTNTSAIHRKPVDLTPFKFIPSYPCRDTNHSSRGAVICLVWRRDRALFRREQHIQPVGITPQFTLLLYFSLTPRLQASSVLAATEKERQEDESGHVLYV